MKYFLSLLILCFSLTTFSQNSDNNSKVILITLDGLRWQELFSGADEALVANKKYVSDTAALKELFWREDPNKRRELLMPFTWSFIATKGQIYGNRNLENKMDLTNTHWFSYPGYNEILTGWADDKRIDSNSKTPNPNKTILELANNSANYKGKVKAFGSWDVFPYIVNEERSGVSVNAGFEAAKGKNLSFYEKYLNKLQDETPSPWSSVRLDVFTHNYALEQLKKENTDFLYIAYGETDDFAHHGDYDAYLKSAKRTDQFIKELWVYVQSIEYYKNKTTFIITTDHGRGTVPLNTWTSHGASIKGAGEVWLIAFGKGINPKGEVKSNQQLYTNQVAPTVMKFLGLDVAFKSKAIDLNN